MKRTNVRSIHYKFGHTHTSNQRNTQTECHLFCKVLMLSSHFRVFSLCGGLLSIYLCFCRCSPPFYFLLVYTLFSVSSVFGIRLEFIAFRIVMRPTFLFPILIFIAWLRFLSLYFYRTKNKLIHIFGSIEEKQVVTCCFALQQSVDVDSPRETATYSTFDR